MWQKVKAFFAPQEEEKDYMAGWEDGYDHGWENSAWEAAAFLEDIGKDALAKELLDNLGVTEERIANERNA